MDIPGDFFNVPGAMSTTGRATPKIGGMKGTTPWTGGKPHKSWTLPKTPFCFRPGVEKNAKVYDDRTGGLTDKFTCDSKKYLVQAFATDVDRSMQEHGMDSVFIIEDDAGEMVNLLYHYSKFTNKTVEYQIKTFWQR